MSEIEPTSMKEAEERLKELSLLMCGGEILDEYVEEFRARGQSQCTNVWAKGIIAYRCRSCQMNDSSAICVDCFQNGHHWEHDYVMYHSESGGCCDCGDRAAWKESGFCTAHQCLDVPEAKVKEELLGPTHIAVQYVLRELLVWIKKISDKQSDQQGSFQQEMDMAMLYLDWSRKVCAVDALRNIVCEDIIDYKILHQTDTSTSSLDVLLHCLGWMPKDLIEAETTLFLQLLYKNDFKDKFLDRLKEKYEKMITLAVDSEAYMKNYKSLDTNLDRVMVQLFNDPEITTSLIHKYDLLELFIGVFSKVVSCAVDNETAVVDVNHEAIKSKVYLRPQGDLRLIVAHKDIAVHLLTKQPQLFPNFLEVLVKLQWMNWYHQNEEDIEFENSWTLAIQLEMNSMAIICQLISRCYQDASGKQTLVTAATYTLKVLKQYLNQGKHIPEPGESGTVSLHIPLHRTFGAILQRLVLLPWDNQERGFLSGLKDNDDFKFTEDEILRLMDHPLRISVWMAEIRAQMWRRSSEEFSRLELIYRGSFWHDQSMDMDILLLQFCTIAFENLQEKVFIRISEGFNFKSEVTTRMVPERSRRPAEICLLQDFIKLILLIVRERRNLGRTEEDEALDTCLQYDIIQWLCVRDQTYSQLCRALSAIPMDHQKLNTMLDRVAIYHEPKVADRGYYQLKPEYWEQFDPLFAHFYLNELEDAEDRAVKVGKLEHYWRITAPPAASAPYDRLSGLLHTKACHLFLLNVLDEVRFLVGVETTATAGEALGVTALQMMAVLVSDSRKNIRKFSNPQLPMGPLEEFPTEDITFNIFVPIQTSDGTNRSIYDMLQVLVLFKQCTRLVDSVNHVLELLCLSSNGKTRAFEVDSQGAEDMQRRLRKEQRQKAILEEFAAKRKAFMETQNVSDDDEESDDGSEMEVTNIADESSGYKSGAGSASETLTKASVPVAEADHVAMETSSESKECVLCKRKRDGKNSSPCWIALVQRYTFPSQVLNRGGAVERTSESSLVSNFHQPEVVISIDDDLDQLVTVGRLAGSEEASAIDFSTVQHVQCCGHQMHYDCFQGHMQTLQLSHDAGKGVVDPGKAEFLCPTCRRLANVLLPDVDASLSSKKHDIHDDGKGVEEPENERRKFWESNKNLERAIDSFCCQVLRVEEQSPQSYLSPPSRFRISQTLWEGLVLNVVHCEVETREGCVKTETASSSSAPTKLSDECTWGGNPSHWIALRELGRLAVLSNTLPGAVQEKSGRLQMLWKSLRLLGRRENLARSAALTESSPVQAGMSDLETIVHEIFPRTPDLVESSDLLKLTDTPPGSSHGQDETVLVVENPGLTPPSTVVGREEKRAYKNTASKYNSQVEESKDSYVLDSKYGISQHSALAAPDPIAPDPQQRYEIKFDEAEFEGRMREGNMMNMIDMSQLSSPEQEGSSLPQEQSKDNWIKDILTNGIVTADPFRLLSLLLIIFNGQPDRRSLRLMVKFAYTVAVLQTQIAVTRLDVEGPEVESFVQRACLPFLRRAAMLVQIITREDFRGQHGLSGTNVMEFLSLQRALQLPDCAQILQPHVHGATETLATQLRHLHDPVSKRFTFELRKVPRKAQLYKPPRVFQELLLENIHNRKTCGFCGEMPADPAICLLCGMLLCCGTDCCKRNGIGECSRHAAEESAGVGIFLLLRSTQLLLIRNNRTCMGLSLYLDIHGEEDLYLRRSQLLYLSELRLNEVRRLWMTAAFDYDSYILRNSQSRPNVY